MLDVRRLRVLCAVADHTTLSAAAESLSYTPSAVSQQIVALEREIGVRVLHRGPRGVRLTATGQLLVDQTRPILATLKAAEASVAAVIGLSAGRLQLASFATAGATILPRAIADFRERHPDVAITLIQADPDAAMAALRAGDVDLIITADAEQRPNDAIEVVTLLEDPLCAVLPSAHPLANRAQLALEELASETWVDVPTTSEARRLLLRACGQAGFIPRVAFESDEYETVQQLVAAGVGVALIPRLALRTAVPGVTLVPLTVPVVREVMAAVHAPQFRAPAANAMIRILREIAATDPV
ncbi:MAG: LysR family transcriptional regulator [Solirubrobacterales bacterium]|nr:LysR family transcriptional regulator [Solirubrobacterales bacterium]